MSNQNPQADLLGSDSGSDTGSDTSSVVSSVEEKPREKMPFIRLVANFIIFSTFCISIWLVVQYFNSGEDMSNTNFRTRVANKLRPNPVSTPAVQAQPAMMPQAPAVNPAANPGGV